MASNPIRKHGKADKAVDGARTRILYVEDHNLNWTIMNLRLQAEYEMVRAKDAREVFQKLRAEEFQLILMDIALRGSDLDGVQITQILKGLYLDPLPTYAQNIPQHVASVPVVFVTAYADKYPKAKLVTAGGEDVAYKPIDFQALYKLLKRLIRD